MKYLGIPIRLILRPYNLLAREHLQAKSQRLDCSQSIIMASESPLKGILERTERPSKQELERNPPFPSNVVPTPDHYGPHPRQTTEPQREILLSSSSVSAFIPLHSTFNYSTKSLSASPAISANPHPTNYELDREDQPESLANQITQLPTPNSVHSTAPWILASREHHRPKMPMDAEFNTHLADIRRQVDGNSSKSTSRSRSLALLGSRVSIAPSAFSQIFSVASLPPAVEFPATPVFRDEFPAEFTRKLERLAVEQRPKARALKSLHYPLQNSRTDIATGSLDTTHEEDNSFSTSSSPNSTPRQQQPMQIPAPTKSVPYYAPNPSRYTPRPQTETPTQTSTQTTLFSDILQQFSGLTFASIASPRITNPLARSPQPSNYSPFPMIPPEHNKANLKAWWNPSTLVRSANGGLFKDPYRGPSILSSSYHKPTTNPACLALDTADHPVFGKPLKEILQYANVEISTANANGDLYVWGYIPIVIAKWSVPPCALPLPSSLRATVAAISRKTVCSCFVRRPVLHAQLLCLTHSNGSSWHI